MPNFRFHFHRDNQIFDENGDPISGSPGGGGVSNPLTEPLDAGENIIYNATVFAGGADGSSSFLNVDDSNASAALEGGSGATGLPGKNVVITGGSGDDGNDAGASITVGGGTPAVPGITNIVLAGGPLTDGTFELGYVPIGGLDPSFGPFDWDVTAAEIEATINDPGLATVSGGPTLNDGPLIVTLPAGGTLTIGNDSLVGGTVSAVVQQEYAAAAPGVVTLGSDLDADGFNILNVAALAGGPGDGSNFVSVLDGNDLQIVGQQGATGLPGKSIIIEGGNGDDGNDPGASITVGGGSGDGTPGSVAITGETLTLNGSPLVPGAIPQGGPLTSPLDVGSSSINGTNGETGVAGTPVSIYGGYGNNYAASRASLVVGAGNSSNVQGSVVMTGLAVTFNGGAVLVAGSGAEASGGGIAIGGYSEASSSGAVAVGSYSDATGNSSVAAGAYSTASGSQSSALGTNSTASGTSSVAAGPGSVSSGNNTVTVGAGSYASGYAAVSAGAGSVAYGAGQIAITGVNFTAGSKYHQRSFFALGTNTTNATPKNLAGLGGATVHEFQDTGGTNNWSQTMIVSGRVVARRTDVAGTDSTWEFRGVLRGNGTDTYSWIGGAAPTPTLIAQDAGASTWAVAVSVSTNAIVVTVTGQSSRTIDWGCVIELDEIGVLRV